MKKQLTETKVPCRIFKVLGSESALKIFVLLGARRKAGVTEIAQSVGLSMSATSHQLSKMEGAGILTSERCGKTVCYAIKPSKSNASLHDCFESLTHP
jgi:DNA-binding transcriptional ArsR family regulator